MKIAVRDNVAASAFEVLQEIDKNCCEPAIAYSRGQLREYLALPGADCVVAEAGRKIAGFLVAAHERRVGYIVTIDVLKAYRRARVGTLLLVEAEPRLAAAGARQVELETATDNVSGIVFLAKHGSRT